jgi:hypothetical protein
LERQVENPTVDLLDRIAVALSIPLGELFLQPLPGEKPPKPMPGGRRKVARRVSTSRKSAAAFSSSPG